MAGQGEQDQHGPHVLHGAVGVLQPGVVQQAGPPGAADPAGRVADLRRGNAGDGLGPLRAELPHVGRQLFEADGPVLHEAPVVQPLLDQHLDHGQGQGPVGARPDGQPAGVGGPDGFGAAVVHHQHLGAPGPGPADAGHGQRGGGVGRVGAPDHHQLGALQVGEGVQLPHPAQQGRGDHPLGGVAVGAGSGGVRGAEGEQQAPGRGLPHAGGGQHLPERLLESAPARVQADRLRAVPAGDLPQPLHDLVQRLLPADARQAPPAPRPCAALGVQQPLGGVDDVLHARDAAAGDAVRVIRPRAQAPDAPALQMHPDGAGGAADAAVPVHLVHRRWASTYPSISASSSASSGGRW